MTKTSKEIQSDFYAMLKNSSLAKAVNGNVYRASVDSSYRPRNSNYEDIEVIFSQGATEQIQKGVITILVYVADIDPYENGVLVENGSRIEELSRMAQDWVDSCPEAGTGYGISQKTPIDSIPIKEINQHAVSIQLNYEYYENK